MSELSTAALHARADAAAANGDFPAALRAAAEALHVTPSDHRARLKVALCFAMLGRADVAVPVLCTVARQLAQGGFLLPALGACRDALGIQPEAPAVKALLGTLHDAIAGQHSRSRARVPPPVVPVEVDPEREGSFLQMDDVTLAGEAAKLGTASPGPDAALPEGAVPFFSDLGKEAFTTLVGRLEYLKVPAGHQVVKQGDEGKSLFVLIEGEVVVARDDEDGGSRELARLGPGSLFGELALITAKPRYANVTTAAPSELFSIDRKLVDELTSTHKDLAGDIAAFARRRVLMNLMATSKLFSPLEEGQRHELLKSFVPRIVETGTVLIKEGADPEGLYVVVEGEVEITKAEESGDKVVLAYLRGGDVFGEIGLVENRPTTATVAVAEHAVVLFLAKDAFTSFAGAHPEWQSYLSTLSAERLEETEDAMSDGVILEADDLIIL